MTWEAFYLYLGRFHPLVVHIPIGFACLLLLIAFLGRSEKFGFLRPAISPILCLSFMASLVASLLGWALSYSKTYDDDILSSHTYAGVAVLITSLLLLVVHKKYSRFIHFYMLAQFFLIVYSVHLGSIMTHGAEYLSLAVQKVKEKVVKNEVLEPEANKKNTLIPILQQPLAIEKAIAGGFKIRIMQLDPHMLDVSFLKKNIEKIPLDLLAPLAKNIVWLNLNGLPLKDKDADLVAQCSNLEKLRIDHTMVGDLFVEKLLGLDHLNAMNLNQTKVSVSSVKKIQKMKSMKTLYLWNTAITEAQIKEMQKDSSKMNIVLR